MARVLITGGAGYVGSHCAKAMAAAGHEVVVLDNLSTGHREFVRWGRLVEGDIRDADLLRSTFVQSRFDAVLHLAALAYVGHSVTDPSAYYDVNVNGTRVLLDAMRAASVSRLVFSSSCAVYGSTDAVPVDEKADQRPINPYGRTKHVAEHMMVEFEKAYGLRSVRLRFFNAAGADADAVIGEDHDPETHLVPLALDVAMGRRPALHVFGSDYATEDGTAVRDFVHVEDLAAAHLAALDRLASGGPSIAVNLGTGTGSSVSQVVAAVERVTGRSVHVVHTARRDGDPPRLVASNALAHTALGWTARRSDIGTVLADAWRWHLKRFGNAS